MTRREALLKKMKEDEAFLAKVLVAYTNDYTTSNIKAMKLYLESNSICDFIFGDREGKETLQSPSNVNNKCILLNIFENMQIEDLAKLLVTISPLSKFPSNSDKIYQINCFNGDEYNMRKQFTDYDKALEAQIKYLEAEYQELPKNKYTHIIDDLKEHGLYDNIMNIIQLIIEDSFLFFLIFIIMKK